MSDKARTCNRVYDSQKAADAAAARHDIVSYARSVVRRWPAATPEKRAEVGAILAPILNRLVVEGAR